MNIKGPLWENCRNIPGLNETQFCKQYIALIRDKMQEVRFFDHTMRFDQNDKLENETVIQLTLRNSKKVAWQTCNIIYAPQHERLAVMLGEYTDKRLRFLDNWKETELTQGTEETELVWMPFALNALHALVAAQLLLSDSDVLAVTLCDYLAAQRNAPAFGQSRIGNGQSTRPTPARKKSVSAEPV